MVISYHYDTWTQRPTLPTTTGGDHNWWDNSQAVAKSFIMFEMSRITIMFETSRTIFKTSRTIAILQHYKNRKWKLHSTQLALRFHHTDNFLIICTYGLFK